MDEPIEALIGMKSAQLEFLFPMPIYRCQVTQSEQLNNQLKQVILAKKAVCDGIIRTNKKGWHSTLDLHTWKDESINSLMVMVKSAASQFVKKMGVFEGCLDPDGWDVEAWANVNPSGASNSKHTHDSKGGIILSSFYYVSIGSPIADVWRGNTWFEDRDTFPSHYKFEPKLFSRTVENIPKPGELILFPSWLPHGVREYRGDGERISIAVNLWHRDINFTKETDKPTPEWAWKHCPKLMGWLKHQERRLR